MTQETFRNTVIPYCSVVKNRTDYKCICDPIYLILDKLIKPFILGPRPLKERKEKNCVEVN